VSVSGNWPSVPLAEAFWFQEGPGVRKWQFMTSGIKLLNVGNIEKDGTLNLSKTERCLDEAEVAKKYSHFLVDAGDLVIASSGISFDEDGLLRTRGAFVEERHLPLCLNTSTIRFKPIDGISDLRFLRLWLNGNEFRSQITKLVTGTAQQNFGPSHLKATKITLPPLQEQRRIAEVLDRAEALRAKRRTALAQLDTLIQSIFLDLFGQPVVSRSEWPISTIGDACTKVSDGTHHSPPIKPHGVPYITAKHLKEHGLDFESDPWFVSEDDHLQIFSRCDPRPGDVLYIKDGATTGIAAVNHYSYEFSMLSSLALLRPNTARLDATYLCSWLNNSQVKRELLGDMAGAAIRRLTLAKIKAVRLPLPPLSLQTKFARRVASVGKLKSTHRKSLMDIDALFSSLQRRAFRGEL
jgi:type I restriction enzyme, S subunit